MSDVYGDSPAVEMPDPFVTQSAADAVSLDSEVDFDDEQDEDQLPLDVVEGFSPGGVGCPARLGDAVDSLAADPQDARHDRRAMPAGDEFTGVGDAQRHSHVRKPFPRISSS